MGKTGTYNKCVINYIIVIMNTWAQGWGLRTDPAVRASLSDHVVDLGAVVLNIQPFSFLKALCLGLECYFVLYIMSVVERSKVGEGQGDNCGWRITGRRGTGR